ncbi:MAG TPA: transmembrane 220 family protein [Vicinamibacteria bacterium]
MNDRRRFGPWGMASLVMALVFLCFTAVQYNDPDPERWMAMYGAAGLVSALAAFRPRQAWLPATAVAAVALAWAAFWLRGVYGHHVVWGQVFATTHMINSDVEETRELFGLAIVAAWMAVLAVRGRRGPLAD